MKLSILMPVYNEESTLGSIVDRVLTVEYPCDIELILVDDGSTEATPKIIDTLEAPRLVTHYHPRNRGKGAAIRTASRIATGEYMIMCDADLEYSPEEIPSLMEVALRGESEVVYGNAQLRQPYRLLVLVRHGQQDRHVLREPALRQLDQRPRDVLQADAGRPLSPARRPIGRLRYGGRGDRQDPGAGDPTVRGSDQLQGAGARGGQEAHVEGRRRGPVDPDEDPPLTPASLIPIANRSNVPVHACPGATHIVRVSGSQIIANRMVEPSSPSRGSGWAQMASPAASWSARTDARLSTVGAAAGPSCRARASRDRLPSDGGIAAAATDGSKAWFVCSRTSRTAAVVAVDSIANASLLGNAHMYE